jgi:hypothetical protein
MLTLSSLRPFAAGLLLAFASASSSAASVLDIVEGKLTGASGVVVNGLTYKVKFVDGTCAQIYGVCDKSNFITNDPAIARLFSLALDQQVFSGMFDTQPEMTFGCTYTEMCGVETPYDEDAGRLSLDAVFNYKELTVDTFGASNVFVSYDWGQSFTYTHALWSLQSPNAIPEPGPLALLAVAGGAMIWSQRRRREVKVVQ